MKRQYGLSLIELMVAILISSILLLGVLQLFSNTSQTDRTNSALAQVQESGRIALEVIGADARRAGYQGCSSAANTLTVGNLTFPSAALAKATNGITFRYATTLNTGTTFAGNKTCDDATLYLNDVTYATCTANGVPRICKSLNGSNASPILANASITAVQFGVEDAGLLSWKNSASATQAQLDAAKAVRVTLTISDGRNEVSRSFTATYDLRNRL
ncbi:PilW family protein [Pseudomonas citronellolis]|uniref:PilW family protein n=1 Tax=Pseudomonas citronellolis TaxID=53408 RepID=UPI0021C06C0D|nr:prepilin-type N-terminal cleavage/methylation domain-containing protein [Pseudomonas citronellolis]MDN6871387.1 prepilin-type N-terminal cleavage/methylation domain-containing protein [Pseudomonas citronellolis]UXJ51805.1 prepilin-type N-terminal cleavage/methylation domain-containing protein [Pseudomonas citronellolis]